MIRWRSVLAGTVTFTVVHLVQSAAWREWFDRGGQYPPWFLNTGRAVAFAAGSLFLAAAIAGALSSASRRDSIVQGGNMGAGALAAMAAVLFITGPGTIFPIVLAFGAAIAVVSSVLGTLLGRASRSRSILDRAERA